MHYKIFNQSTIIPLWPIVLFLIIFLDKIFFVNSSVILKNYYEYLHSQLLYLVLIEDASLFFMILIISLFYKTRVKYLSLFLILFLCACYLIDNIIIQSLYTRFTILAIYKYYPEVSIISTFLSTQTLIYFASLVFILWIIRKKVIRLPIKSINLIIFWAGFALLPWLLFSNNPINPTIDMVSLNVIRINQQVVFNRNFSTKTILKTKQSFPRISEGLSVLSNGADLRACPNRKQPNLIILLSESLSQVDSTKSGGIFDRLPRIDRIQAQGLTFTNVVANGSNTSDALAALLLGIEPLPAKVFSNNMPSRFPPKTLNKRNLITHAKQLGYKTIALTNASLNFEKNGEWLAEAGFDDIVGGESDIFQDQPRFTFNSPSDEALYSQALSEINKQEQPFLLFLLTVSLHRPYILPSQQDLVTDNPLLNLLNYVDRTTWEFYQHLQNINFFDNGILLLIGDHRRMAQLEAEEMNLKGLDGYGRVIGSFIGSPFDKGQVDNTPFNQTDFNTMMHSIINGCDLDTYNLADYHKYRLLGIKKPFTTHLLNEDLGLLLIRAEQQNPWIIKLHSHLEPNRISAEPFYRKIAAYLILNSAWLGEKQDENKNRQ